MKRLHPDVPPYLSWALIVRDTEAHLPGGLEACLKSLRERTPDAEIVIVDTMSSDAKTVEIAQKYADVWTEYAGPNGDWTREMYAFDDAAAARNHAFSLAHGRWIGWIDDDDRLVGPEEAEALLKQNGRFKPTVPGRELATTAPEISTLEDLLRLVERLDPEADCIVAPYLYRKDESGNALQWQERERIVKATRPGGWKWTEAAHEVLVAKDGIAKNVYFEHFLYVHGKKWTLNDVIYSVRRHYKIMLDRYEKGDRGMRVLRYLCIYAGTEAPARWGEFVAEWLRTAVTQMDIYRSRVAAGQYEAARGLYDLAIAHFGAATVMVPSLPDAWIAGGRAAEQAEDWGRAAQWYAKALEGTPNFADSDTSPREWSLTIPTLAAYCLQKLATVQIEQGQYEAAERHFKLAYTLMQGVLTNPIVGSDRDEAMVLANEAKNLAEAQTAATAVEFLFDYLRRNDETIKAADLLKALPHKLEDDPRIIKLEQRISSLHKHLTDPAAYAWFYDHLDTTTDAVPTDTWRGGWLTPEGCLPRAKMLIEWLKARTANGAEAKVLEMGSYDGIISIPVLTACPKVKYRAIDAGSVALARMHEYAKRLVPDGDARLSTQLGSNVLHETAGHYDAVVLFEVIEHVPDPAAVIRQLLEKLKPDGRLFVSTPWQAFDRGQPDESKKPRDPRGHVRAMTAKDMVDTVQAGGGEVETCFNQHLTNGYGNTMHVVVKKGADSYSSTPRRLGRAVNFFVASSLWEWNASHVEKTGIGASEKTIVHLARELAKEGRVNVFAPVPEEEVHAGVAYWDQHKVRHIDPNVPFIVSRAPSALAALKHKFGIEPKRPFLWLQDAWYPDLNADTAKLYEKVIVLTDWHKQIMHENHGVPLDKMVCINNFLVEQHFTWPEDLRPKRDPHRFFYSSSPDRALIPLLKMWPAILKLYPDATLDIFYGWEGASKLAHITPDWAVMYKPLRDQYEALGHQTGVRSHGRVNHSVLAFEMARSAAWLYPVLSFGETGCATAFEAMAAGAVPVTVPLAGLAETGESPWTKWVEHPEDDGQMPRFEEAFVKAVQAAVEMPEDERRKMSAFAIEKFRLPTVAKQWKALIDG